MDSIQLHSRIGSDGVLKLDIPLGVKDANSDVLITLRAIRPASATPKDQPWQDFLDETYGSCASLGLERAPQGDYETREDATP